MQDLRLGVSAASSWAWGTSLVVGMEIAQTKGLLAFGIWATANAAALAVFGILAPRIKAFRAFERPVIRAGTVLREVTNLYVQFGLFWNQKNWRDVYQILIAGDPKKRSLRALRTQSVLNRNEKNAAR